MRILWKSKSVPVHWSKPVAVLDVGSSRVLCVIVRCGTNGAVELLSYKHELSSGIASGIIMNRDEAFKCIGAALVEAQRNANCLVEEVHVVSANCNMFSECVDVSISMQDAPINSSDLNRLMLKAVRDLPRDLECIHALPVRYAVDGKTADINSLSKLKAKDVTASLNIISVPKADVELLRDIVLYCEARICGLSTAAYTSAIACLTPEEKLGITLCIDIGAQTMSCGLFSNNACIFNTSVPFGSHHITKDIAYAFHLSVMAAERVKIAYGATMVSAAVIGADVSVFDEATGGEITISAVDLTEVIAPRVEEMFALAYQRVVEGAPIDIASVDSIVLTGDGSKLSHMADTAQFVTYSKVRLARAIPRYHNDTLAGCASPALIGYIDLLVQKLHAEMGPGAQRRDNLVQSVLRRVFNM